MVLLTLWLVTTVEAAAAEVRPPLPAVGASCVACLTAGARATAAFSDTEWKALRAGQVLKSYGERRASSNTLSSSNRASGLLEHPPESVWAVLTDFESWPGFMPHIRETQITRKHGSLQWVHQRYKIMFVGLQHTTIYDLDPLRGQLHWALDTEQEHDIQGSHGRWELHEADDGRSTLVRYYASVDTGKSVPGFVEKMLLTKSLDELFSSLRGEVDRRSQIRADVPIMEAVGQP